MPIHDRELLFYCSENARGKVRELALKVKKSPQRVKYNVGRFITEGIIYNPHTIIDYSTFGLLLFRVYFKGGYISERDKVEIIRQLMDNHFLIAMYEVTGEFDFVIELLAPNPSRFNKEIKKVAAVIPTFHTYKVLLNIVTHIYPRSYLLPRIPGIGEQEIIIGGDRELLEFSKNDKLVMKGLLKEPQTRLSNLAQRTELNRKTVMSVIKNLHKRKVIRGTKFLIETNKLGFYKQRLFLRLHNATPERESQMFTYLLLTKEVVQVNKTVGDWDLEIDIESPEKARVRYLILELRENFQDLIETFNMVEFYHYYKKSYLPSYVLES